MYLQKYYVVSLRLITKCCKYHFCKKEENRSTFSAKDILAGVYVTFAVQDFTTFSNRRSEVRYTHKKTFASGEGSEGIHWNSERSSCGCSIHNSPKLWDVPTPTYPFLTYPESKALIITRSYKVILYFGTFCFENHATYPFF